MKTQTHNRLVPASGGGRIENNAMRVTSMLAHAFSVSIERLLSPERTLPLPAARFIAFSMLRDAGHSPYEIAAAFKRERTTILYGIRMADRLRLDRRLLQPLQEMRENGFKD